MRYYCVHEVVHGIGRSRPERRGRLGELSLSRKCKHIVDRIGNRMLAVLSLFCCGILLVQTWCNAASADALDDAVANEMKAHGIPGVSVSVVKDGKIVKSKGYGQADKESGAQVTTKTLFLAGSISKPVSALGALILVEKGKLSLDADVNDVLRSWKVPDNEFTKEQKVTLSRILSHSAGFTIHGFSGYSAESQLPTLVQILNGERPANTIPIRVIFTPGSKWQYSGGGYMVLQQLIIDVSGKSFPDFMKESVLAPLEMGRSTYEQPLPDALVPMAASGHGADGKRIQGRWHIYPEMTAAGLWTTPEDLCRYIVAVQNAWSGKQGGVISPAMARNMLTTKSGEYGLGLCLKNGGKNFQHGGRDEGFDAFLYASSNIGVVVMINANDNSGALGRILNAAWSQYGK